MLDYDFTERLGDFGMVRFEDYGDSLPETAAIRTTRFWSSLWKAGYFSLQPELTTMWNSTRTYVYAFGAFMVEITCGRIPLYPKIPAEKRHLSVCKECVYIG